MKKFVTQRCSSSCVFQFFRIEYFSVKIKTEDKSVFEAMAQSMISKQFFFDESLLTKSNIKSEAKIFKSQEKVTFYFRILFLLNQFNNLLYFLILDHFHGFSLYLIFAKIFITSIHECHECLN